MNTANIELLAPAGSYEGFEAALGAGADAVYVGGAVFGARAYAPNFTEEELLRAIDTAHLHNKKLYLTVNTLLKNRELQEQLYDYLAPFYEAGLDAAIVQDLGVLRFIRRNFPGLAIHASTQMTVTGPYGMKFLEEHGAARVVAARELSLRELAAMHQASPIEIEAFVHGALCYSFSGQCLMSSLLGGRSGNRGRCAQPCRLSYQVKENGGLFKAQESRSKSVRARINRPKDKQSELCPLSLKDICTIDLLPDIIEAGVTSLKIEGRMKQPGYTAGVTSVYRKYLDLLFSNGADAYRVEERDRQYLLDLFNRGGSCTGYYAMHNGPSMMAFTNEKKIGDTKSSIRKRKEKIHGNLILFCGSPAILEVSCSGVHGAASIGEVQRAQNRPMDEACIRRQMERLGNTDFAWEQLDIQMDDNIFIPVKMLNELRREALEQLARQMTGQWRRTLQPCIRYEPAAVTKKAVNQPCVDKKAVGQPHIDESPAGRPRIYVSCETAGQALALCGNPEIRGLYLPFDSMKACMEAGVQKNKELYLALPHITRGDAPEGYFRQAEEWLSRGMAGFLVRNLEAFGLLKDMGYAGLCVLDHSMYTWNDEAAAFWQEEGILRNTVPLELNEKELRHRDNRDSELLIYGYLPLMVSAQCVRKNLSRCDRKEGKMFLKDRYDKVFTSQCVCCPWKMKTTETPELCYNIIYNSIPYGLMREKRQVEALKIPSLRLAFTLESPSQAEQILKEFLEVYLHGQAPSDREFTKGHFKRGAE
ncbi:MAG: DUF3656 domain-containing protein [Eubacteriales bacterium]|nr:DUF3656 domain-containing protein [Eubacteriales bacterium]